MPIRPAIAADIPQILQLIRDLAEYEKALNEVSATEEDLKATLFCEDPQVFCHVAIENEENDDVVGIAIWHLNYSTWLGKHGIYLEDLYVRPEARGGGIGTALLKELAKICVDRGYQRFQWWVLDWNKPSIDFYKSFGAVAMDEWTVFRLSDGALKVFSETA